MHLSPRKIVEILGIRVTKEERDVFDDDSYVVCRSTCELVADDEVNVESKRKKWIDHYHECNDMCIAQMDKVPTLSVIKTAVKLFDIMHVRTAIVVSQGHYDGLNIDFSKESAKDAADRIFMLLEQDGRTEGLTREEAVDLYGGYESFVLSNLEAVRLLKKYDCNIPSGCDPKKIFDRLLFNAFASDDIFGW